MFCEDNEKLKRIKYKTINISLKIPYMFATVISIMLVTSCVSTKFTEYRGSEVIEGKGGTIRVVDGIDFWENGEPDRKYRIIGVIDDSRGDGLISALSQDGAIAKLTRKRGGNAVILTDNTRELQGVDLDSGDTRYKRMTKFMVVKYVP